jgi:integrase
MSDSHLKKLRLVMRELFGKAYDLGYLRRNPAAGLELPEGTSNERRSLTPLEREAFDRIIREGLHRGCLFYRVMLLCGLRPGECAALEWQHIDFDRAVIRVEQAKESGSSTIKDPKTDSGFREVPVRPDLLEELRSVRGLPGAPVFIRKHGGRHTDTSLRAMWTSWKRLMDKTMAIILVERAHRAGDVLEAERILSGLDGDFSAHDLAAEVCSDRYKSPMRTVTYRNKLVLHGEPEELLDSLVAYDLRHTYCTDLQKAGVDLKTASYLMGHADITTTANIYSHTDTELVEAAADKIRAYAGL